jgi:hypothetical protein
MHMVTSQEMLVVSLKRPHVYAVRICELGFGGGGDGGDGGGEGGGGDGGLGGGLGGGVGGGMVGGGAQVPTSVALAFTTLHG